MTRDPHILYHVGGGAHTRHIGQCVDRGEGRRLVYGRPEGWVWFAEMWVCRYTAKWLDVVCRYAAGQIYNMTRAKTAAVYKSTNSTGQRRAGWGGAAIRHPVRSKSK